MTIKQIEYDFCVCTVKDYSLVDLNQPYTFIGKTDEENSLVCITRYVPKNVIKKEDGWKAFRIEGSLEFSLVGVLSKISSILAEQKIGIFAISTFQTDYILTKKTDFQNALKVLKENGYQFKEDSF